MMKNGVRGTTGGRPTTNNLTIGDLNMKKITIGNGRSEFPFSVDEFRNDIVNNVEFKEIKSKYKIYSRLDLDGYIYRLSRKDNKVYDYKHQDIVRCNPVYESKDGFIKISQREVKRIKLELKCDSFLKFGELKLSGKKIIINIQ